MKFEKFRKFFFEPRLSVGQYIGLLTAIIYYMFDSLGLFKDLGAWASMIVYVGISVFLAATGTKVSIKQVLMDVKKLLDEKGDPAYILNRIENAMHLLAVKAGFVWERLLDEQFPQAEGKKKDGAFS